jgi:hypothetical protein
MAEFGRTMVSPGTTRERSSLPECYRAGESSANGCLGRATCKIAAVQRRWREFRVAPSSCERDAATLPKIWTPFCRAAIALFSVSNCRLSSPGELTLVVGRWLRPIVRLLDVVRRLGLWSTSSREQRSTALNH